MNYTEEDVEYVATMAFYRYYKKFIEEFPDEDCGAYFDDVGKLIKEELDRANFCIDDGTIETQRATLSKFLQKKRHERGKGSSAERTRDGGYRAKVSREAGLYPQDVFSS